MSTSLQCVLRSDVARLYRRISKRLAVETTSFYCSCFITPSHHSCSLAWPDPRRKREGLATPDYRSCSSLLKSTHAISIDFAEMHADHIVSSGSPHNNVLHFSSYYYYGNPVRTSPARRCRDRTGSRSTRYIPTRPRGRMKIFAFSTRLSCRAKSSAV